MTVPRKTPESETGMLTTEPQPSDRMTSWSGNTVRISSRLLATKTCRCSRTLRVQWFGVIGLGLVSGYAAGLVGEDPPSQRCRHVERGTGGNDRPDFRLNHVVERGKDPLRGTGGGHGHESGACRRFGHCPPDQPMVRRRRSKPVSDRAPRGVMTTLSSIRTPMSSVR